jgi:polyhydroxybutyrate depolymerase
VLSVAAVVVGLPLVAALVAIAAIFVLDRANGSLEDSGRTREYLLHVPDSYDSATPTPLIISMHGGFTWPAHQLNLSRWNRLADEHGFIVVYPSGSSLPNSEIPYPKMWHTFDPGPRLEQDVRFIAKLIDTLRSAYNVDPARIYANGMSNGGMMAFVLSCTLADRIAAVGLVAAAPSLPPGWCTDRRPVPMIAFHGDADLMVPYGGGPFPDRFNPAPPVFPAARDWVMSWAQRNRCAAGPVESTLAPDAVRSEFPDCAQGAAVVLYTLLGGGHTWPGGKPLPEWWVGPTNTSVDATREMWAFFREHRLREAQQ